MFVNKIIKFNKRKMKYSISRLLSPCHFYIKLVGGKKNGEVLAPPSWASWVDEIFSGQFGGYIASWLRERGWGTSRAAALSAQGSFTARLVDKTWAWTLGQELGFVVSVLHFSETDWTEQVST